MDKRSQEKIINIEVYTDGSLKKQGQKSTFGGWAYIAVQDGKELFCDLTSLFCIHYTVLYSFGGVFHEKSA